MHSALALLLGAAGLASVLLALERGPAARLPDPAELDRSTEYWLRAATYPARER